MAVDGRAGAPDEALVLAAMLSDLEAFDELVRRYRPAVVATARSVVGAADSEDVAQDALLLAFKALPSLEDPRRFASWLRVITRHRALRWAQHDAARRRRRVEIDDVLLQRVSALSSRPSAPERTSEELEVLLRAIPEDYGQVLRLRFFHEMPLGRIAAYLGVPLSTVKWRIHRGKRLVRERIQSRGRDLARDRKRTKRPVKMAGP